MFERFRRARRAHVVLALLTLVAVGYLSNTLSATACERAADRWLSDRLSESPRDWPWRRASSEPAKSRLPWILAVDYEYVAGNLGGEWGTRYYLGLFGLSIPIRNHIRVQS